MCSDFNFTLGRLQVVNNETNFSAVFSVKTSKTLLLCDHKSKNSQRSEGDLIFLVIFIANVQQF